MSSTNPAPYPGNPSLPREVREKILSTFRHTLNLFGEGKLDDCVIGCDFILKMDPRFAPARRLMEKARNPRAEVDVAELEAIVSTTPTRQERVVAVDPDRLLVRAVESFNARDFDAAISAADQVLEVLPRNQDALEIRDQARAKKAAQPVFDASRLRAVAALDGRRLEEARAELERMRELDPDHPAVALLERRIGTAPPRERLNRLEVDAPGLVERSALGTESSEPHVGFRAPAFAAAAPHDAAPQEPAPAADAGSELDGLTLDSLSLDTPAESPQVMPPPPDPLFASHGPLEDPRGAERPPRGSPGDLWSEPASGPEIDFSLSPETEASRETPPESPPSSPRPKILRPVEEPGRPRSTEMEIASLLRQGDDAASKGDRQQAIEVWSRIFLIDINNSEAVSRIEKARQDMAEGNRVVSEGLKTGREKFEAGDYAGAREAFLQVLAIDENEPTARSHLNRIQEQLTSPGEDADRERPPVPSVSSPAAVSASAPAPPEARRPPARAIRINRAVGLIAVFALLALAGIFFVFRVARPKAAAAKAEPAPAAASVRHAEELAAAGKLGEARAELLRVAPSSPEYAAARKMMADLGKGSAPAGAAVGSAASAPPPPASSGAPASKEGEAALLRAAAEKALAEKRYIDALKNFHLAAAAFRDDPTFAQEMGTAADKVSALTPAVKLYNEGEYETAIPVLWRISQEDRENKDARSYLLRAYYNQGVTQLQNGLYPKAAQSFTEALSIDPADAEAIRHKKFAERYRKGDLDLMGRIYVRHLNHRP